MRKLNRVLVGAALVLGALCVGAAPSHAGGGWHGGYGWHGGWHGGGWGGGTRVAVGIGIPGYWGPPGAAFWGWGPYYRPYAYGYYGGYYAAPPVVYSSPPVVIQSAPVYIERQPAEDATAAAPPGPEPAYWYYCASKRQYYPKVSTCREPWVKVLAQNP